MVSWEERQIARAADEALGFATDAFDARHQRTREANQVVAVVSLPDRRRSIVASNALYGLTIKMFDQLFSPFGVEVTYTDICDLDEFSEVVAESQPGVIFIGSISNPLMRVGRLDTIAEIARSAGAALIVDNTFATP